MALVKTSTLTKKSAAQKAKPAESVRPPVREKPAAKKVEHNRARNKHAKATERIGAATEQLSAGISQAASAAEELRRSLEQIAAAAEEAAGAAQESEAAVTGLGALFTRGREHAVLSKANTGKLQSLLLESSTQIDSLVNAVQENSTRQLASVEVASMLVTQATKIGEITKVVADVSDETNLLALNAAIEAARAGDHGRGFSVVADEVRAFAEASEKSALEVQQLAESVSADVRLVADRIKAAAELAQREAESGRGVVTELEVIRKDMRIISDSAQTILMATEAAETGAREAQRGALSVASAAEQQSSATAEAQQAVEQQSRALDQSQAVAAALSEVADNLQSGRAKANAAEHLASSAEELSATVQELSGAANEILTAVDQISQGAQEQAAATQESSSAMAQIESSALAMRASAAEAGERILALEPKLAANKAAVSKLDAAISTSVRETLAVGELLGSLQDSGRRIEKIVDAIALIAVQTNMLAVSGSVEAARAREFGRGFAIVSTDIRNLSRQSAENAGRAKDVAVAIQEQISLVRRDLQTIASISESEVRKNKAVIERLVTVQSEMDGLKQGSGDLVATSDVILGSVREVLSGVHQIAAASEEASAAATESAAAAREQAQGAEDLAAAIEEIAGLADEMQKTKT